MSQIRSKGSKAERALGSAMWKQGLRYRKHYKKLIGTPDFVFVSARVAVFCDGDFWHGRDFEDRLAKGRFNSNRKYWIKKITRNRERDSEINTVLRTDGWTVLRFWESDILRDAGAIAEEVAEVVH